MPDHKKYFRCHQCGGNFKEENRVYFENQEICEWCWEEIHESLVVPFTERKREDLL